PRAGSTCSAVGVAGPGPKEATYAASCFVWVGFICGGLASACGAVDCIGIRPVPTWKLTDAAPTPMSDGTLSVPDASLPWQVEQFARKSFCPSAMSSLVVVSALAVVGVKAAYK